MLGISVLIYRRASLPSTLLICPLVSHRIPRHIPLLSMTFRVWVPEICLTGQKSALPFQWERQFRRAEDRQE